MKEGKAKRAFGVINGGKHRQVVRPGRDGALRTNETPDRPSQPLTPEEIDELRDDVRANDLPRPAQ